jgi:outer membrane protein assembly factor BamB
VAIASWDNATHVVSGATGAQPWRTPAGTLNGGDVWAVDRVDDVTGDGIPDVIAGSFDRNAYLYNGATGAIVWSVDVGARVFSVRGVSDLSGNGIPDVLVGTQMLNGVGGKLFALEGNDVTTGVGMPVPIARPVADAIDGVGDVAFRAGTTFNVYRRSSGRRGGKRPPPSPPPRWRSPSGKTAREQKAEVRR